MEPVLRACEGGALFAAVRDSGHGDFSDLTARGERIAGHGPRGLLVPIDSAPLPPTRWLSNTDWKGTSLALLPAAWSIPLVRMALTAIGEEVKEDPLLLLARINAATRWFISRCEEQDAGALEPADVARLSEALGGADEDAELRIGGKAVRATAQAALELKGSKVVLQ